MMIMTYYEIKKVFSKKGSKVALIFIFIVISVVLSFIIGDGDAHVCSCGAVNIAITNKRLASFGLISMLDYYTERCVTC